MGNTGGAISQYHFQMITENLQINLQWVLSSLQMSQLWELWTKSYSEIPP